MGHPNNKKLVGAPHLTSPCMGVVILKDIRIIRAESLIAGCFPTAHLAALCLSPPYDKRKEWDNQEEKEEREPGDPAERAECDRPGQQEQTEFPGFHANTSGFAGIMFRYSELLRLHGRQTLAGHPQQTRVRG